MLALTRLALVGLIVFATTKRCGRPRFGGAVDKTGEAA
jgi:hypothetical protein